MNKLNEGDLFPSMTLALADGGQVSLPGDISTPYQVVLFYRGHW
ncbi:MAG: hypothetical protein ACR2QQ_14725 [Gammaproteobacteria bacterium]